MGRGEGAAERGRTRGDFAGKPCWTRRRARPGGRGALQGQRNRDRAVVVRGAGDAENIRALDDESHEAIVARLNELWQRRSEADAKTDTRLGRRAPRAGGRVPGELGWVAVMQYVGGFASWEALVRWTATVDERAYEDVLIAMAGDAEARKLSEMQARAGAADDGSQQQLSFAIRAVNEATKALRTSRATSRASGNEAEKASKARGEILRRPGRHRQDGGGRVRGRGPAGGAKSLGGFLLDAAQGRRRTRRRRRGWSRHCGTPAGRSMRTWRRSTRGSTRVRRWRSRTTRFATRSSSCSGRRAT